MDLLRTTVKVPGKRPPRAISAFGPSASINGLVKDMSTVQMGEGPGEWGPGRVHREGDRDRGRWREELVLPWLCGVATDSGTGSLIFLPLLLPEATTPMPSPSPSPSSLQLPPDQTSKHLLKPDRNLARALSTG